MVFPGPLTPALSIRRSGQMVESDVDGEIVALHVEKGICYGLNKVGSQIWRLAAAPAQISYICATLQNEYDVTPERCERQVLELLEHLQREGLIEIFSTGALAAER